MAKLCVKYLFFHDKVYIYKLSINLFLIYSLTQQALELWQKITGLGLITSVAIGDIFNYGRNALVVICGDGWTHIFYSPRSVHPSNASVSAGHHAGKDTNDQDNSKTGVNKRF